MTTPTTTHKGIPPVPARPPPVDTRRRRHRRDWGRTFAVVLCGVLAFVGAMPFLTTIIVRSHWAQGWAAHETQRLLRQQGIDARYELSLRIWPLALVLDRLRVDSSDGGAPAIVCARVSIRPRLFALLAGKIAIDQIDLEAPRVRAVVREGRLANLALPATGAGTSGPAHAPFGAFSVTDGAIDLNIDGTIVSASSIDVDASADDDRDRGSSYETALRIGAAQVRRERSGAAGAVDEDTLCALEGRARLEPDALIVRHLELVALADLDAASGTAPPCAAGSADKRRVELSLGHAHVRFPGPDQPLPLVDGHVRLRAPLALASRLGPAPALDGWVVVDADVRYGADTLVPDFSGTIEGHDVRLDRYALAQELRGDVTIRRNVVRSSRMTVALANGLVTLSDTVVDPLLGGGRLERTRLDASGIDFTALMRALGVHPHSWVGWDIREIHAPLLAGGFAPLKIDGELTAKTASFGVYDRPAEDPARERLFGFSEAQLAARVAVRPDALNFLDLRAALPHSQIEGATVSLGFRDDLRVDVPRLRADLEDISPVGPVAFHGKLEASAHVGGVFNHPEPEGDIRSATGLVVSDVAFGDLIAGHVTVDVKEPKVELTGVRARRGVSAYGVPTARLAFGGSRGFVVDAVGESDALGLRDLLSMFALESDPRFEGLDATIRTRADVRVAVGGAEDACGGGYVGLRAAGHLRDVAIYGERFAQGDADVTLHWWDRARGLAGADLDVRSFVLNKVQPPTGSRSGATGTVFGSATIRRGGEMAANVAIEGVPLGRVDALGAFAGDVEGSVSGVAHVRGNMDEFAPDAGYVVHGSLDVAGTHVRGVPLSASHLDVTMTDHAPRPPRIQGRTRCRAPLGPPFDKKAYLADASSHGEWTIGGALLGGSINLRDVVVTRARSHRVSGRVSLRGVDLGPLARIVSGGGGDRVASELGAAAIGGQLWGELIVDEAWLDAPERSRARLFLGPTVVSRGRQKLSLQPPREPIVLANDALTMPTLEATLDTPDGFRGGFELTGSATHVSTDPELAIAARLEPIDLAAMQRIVPRVDRASGRVEGALRVSGRARAPRVDGELHAIADDLEIRGLPTDVSDVRLDVRASATQLTASGTGLFAGGTIAFHGSVPVHGLVLGPLESRISVRGVRMVPADGVAISADADLQVTYDPNAGGGPLAALPHVGGEVAIGSLSYTRPVTFNLDLASARAKRTVVDTYDPALDFVTFDVAVQARAPMTIKNNLVEVQLRIDSGSLEVTGTNQRLGLRGALRAMPGGRFHFQGNDFEVQQGVIRFDDPTRIDPNVDITAVTEYRRYTDSSAGAAAGAGTSTGPAAASVNSTQGGSLWRITMHAYGDADAVRVELTSEPALSQDDIVLLLTIGMTRAELDQLQASGIGASVAVNVIGAATGADRAVKQAIPIIDDFRFGSAYSTATGKTEPQLTVGKRLTNELRASVQAGLSEDRELRANIEWRLNNRLSLQGSYDNINDVSSSTLGNIGLDLRWRLDFQ